MREHYKRYLTLFKKTDFVDISIKFKLNLNINNTIFDEFILFQARNFLLQVVIINIFILN
jgi:hypothetical protein